MVTGITINGDGTATWTITAADTLTLPFGNVAAELVLWPGLPGLADLYGYWPLSENAGSTRARTLGTSSASGLAEVGGTVAVVPGKFGQAIHTTLGGASSLGGTLTPVIDVAPGFSVSCWFNLSANRGNPQILLRLSQGVPAGVPHLHIYRNVNPSDTLIISALGADLGLLGYPAISTGVWHLVTTWFDPATNLLWAQLDDGINGAQARLISIAIDPAQVALANALDTFTMAKSPGGSYVPWDGDASTVRVWNRALTALERSLLFIYPQTTPDTITGTVEVLAPTTTAAGSAAWSTSPAGWSVALSSVYVTPGTDFTSTLTVSDQNGAQVDLTGFKAFMHVSHDPQGSSTKIPFNIPTHRIVSGHVYYTDRVFGSPTIGQIFPWSGVTVQFFSDQGGPVVTTTDDTGAYSYIDPVSVDAISAYIQVDSQIPPGQGGGQTGSTAIDPKDVVLGQTLIDLTCDGGG